MKAIFAACDIAQHLTLMCNAINSEGIENISLQRKSEVSADVPIESQWHALAWLLFVVQIPSQVPVYHLPMTHFSLSQQQFMPPQETTPVILTTECHDEREQDRSHSRLPKQVAGLLQVSVSATAMYSVTTARSTVMIMQHWCLCHCFVDVRNRLLYFGLMYQIATSNPQWMRYHSPAWQTRQKVP